MGDRLLDLVGDSANTTLDGIIIISRQRHTGQGSHRPGKVLEFDLGPGKLLEFQNSVICPEIVLEFCKIALENVKLSLKIIKYTDSFPFFWIYAMRE